MTDISAKQVQISGRVQGVSYRAWAQRAARRRGIKGWVRNMPDGTVMAHLEGPQDAVRGLINDLRGGPAMASVKDIEQSPAAPEGAESFEVVG
ncbi:MULTISPECIES: acylphosphatase [Sediminimonas]|uniref:acylphosphatase n=1 Tax=Sediminimonas TaxID=659427 RepID=UPI000413E2C6|nr:MULTISPECIES: acylphosphatase [Sediminimonas]MDR9483647.1 acylphosphatase [Sediminimonas sp.]